MSADLRAAAQQAIALICSARLCEVNSMSSRQEMLRLLIEATDLLRAALVQQAEPVEPVAWMYTGVKQDGIEHGPHLVWKPEYMDAMSASKGAKVTPLYTAPPQRPAKPVA